MTSLFCFDRFQHHRNDYIPHGWVVPFWLLWTHSKKCGYQKGNTMKMGTEQYIAKPSSLNILLMYLLLVFGCQLLSYMHLQCGKLYLSVVEGYCKWYIYKYLQNLKYSQLFYCKIMLYNTLNLLSGKKKMCCLDRFY